MRIELEHRFLLKTKHGKATNNKTPERYSPPFTGEETGQETKIRPSCEEEMKRISEMLCGAVGELILTPRSRR
jgi:hypothetical protein